MKDALVAAAALTVMLAASAFGQATPPDDTPKVAVGGTIFADYTWVESPETKDVDGNTIHANAFNISRAYINFTGNLNHLIAFRITPDVVRESGSGSSLNGSLTFRLKYAFGQLNLDDWITHGSWLRFGLQQTPYIDYNEGIYRYRFQGPVFADREGFLSASDLGFSGHYNFPGNYGDVHAGIYNGENYNHPEANNEKAFEIRGTIRPLPLGGVWNGLRLTAFYDADHYVQGARRARTIGQISFEHPRFNAAIELLSARDRTSSPKPTVDADGYSVWATPKLGTKGWELLLRRDVLKPDKGFGAQKRTRDIAGIAYWFPHMQRVTSAIMLDYDSLKQSGFTPFRPTDTRYGIKMLVNF